MVRPGEGETTAAARLLDRLLARYSRFFDAVVADGIYLQGPFIHYCRERGKHVLAVLKENNPALLEDARALVRGQPPLLTREENGRTCRYWDVEELTSGEAAAQHPLRVIHTEETETKRHHPAPEWIEETTKHFWWWATTIPQSVMPARQIAQVGHGRWGIENECFNQLSAHWALDHCFHHDPTAILNFILICLIAYTLVQCFHLLNVKPPLRARFTLIALARQIFRGIATLANDPAPWLRRKSHPPPS